MKKGWLLSCLLFILLVGGCSQNGGEENGIPNEHQTTDETATQQSENEVAYELLMQLDFMPHEVGTTISLIQDKQLYNIWAELFQFKSVPTIDFTTEEVLFITTYSDGCGRVLDRITKENDQLIVQLHYPKDIRNKKEIVCTEIALPKTFVVKLEKSGLTHGTLIDVNRTLLENELLLQR